ncbi:hypothetical protein V5O48_007808 [Marasmius crinis-equi]|uniref:Uncharacterized protein n=1 Tax=Marasmius crinis-equi TaxID=585013 RepID=A0ABR3FFS2_9AGAR
MSPTRDTQTTLDTASHDRDDIQEILASFYLDDASPDSGSEDDEEYPSSDSERSHTHCGKDELEARELYDLYGDDDMEDEERRDDGEDDDACSSSTQDSDYDYPPDLSPTAECPPSIDLAGNSHRGPLDERGLGHLGATYAKPKPKGLDVAIENAESGGNVGWRPCEEERE